MIATSTIRAQAGEKPPVYLAPYTVEDLGDVFPLSPRLVSYEQRSVIEALSTNDAATVWGWEADAMHSEIWGIFAGSISPQSLIGNISMSQHCISPGDPGNEIYSRSIQELGFLIWSESHRNQGIGSLAALAVAHTAFASDKVHIINAWTSARNTAAQRSLYKAGLTRIGAHDYLEFQQEELTQHWALPNIDGQDIVIYGDSPETKRAMYEGWARHRAAIEGISIQQIEG